MEMADELALELLQNQLVTDQIVLTVGYDVANLRNYKGEVKKDRYGRKAPKHAHGTINLDDFNNSSRVIIDKSVELFDRIVNHDLTIRRIYVVANHVRWENSAKPLRQLDIFTDYTKNQEELAKDKRRQDAILEIKKRYGKNAILKGINFEEGATMRERHKQVGGHRA